MTISYLISVQCITDFKVLSMKINYLAPSNHKHKHKKFVLKN
jgi:hypothetical protein